jgi:hypothetical protein
MRSCIDSVSIILWHTSEQFTLAIIITDREFLIRSAWNQKCSDFGVHWLSIPNLKIWNLGLDVIVHAYNLSYLEAEMGKIEVQGQPGQKMRYFPSLQTSWIWLCAPLVLASWGIGVTIMRPLAKIWDPIWKITEARKGCGHALSGRVPVYPSVRPWVQTLIPPHK